MAFHINRKDVEYITSIIDDTKDHNLKAILIKVRGAYYYDRKMHNDKRNEKRKLDPTYDRTGWIKTYKEHKNMLQKSNQPSVGLRNAYLKTFKYGKIPDNIQKIDYDPIKKELILKYK